MSLIVPYRIPLLTGPQRFDALSIPNLELWLKADSVMGLNNGDLVSTWLDSSNHGRDASQGISVAQPIYTTGISPRNRAGITFSGARINAGVNKWMHGFLPGSPGVSFHGGYTFYIRMNVTGGLGQAQVVFQDDTGSNPQLFSDDNPSTKVGWRDSGGTFTGGTGTTGIQTLVWVFNGTNTGSGTVYRDGSSIFQHDFAFNPSDTGYYFGANQVANVALNAHVFEFLWYSSAHDDKIRGIIERYLTLKWG